MYKSIALVLTLCLIVAAPAAAKEPAGSLVNQIIATERAALTSWLHGDPNPYCVLHDPEMTYFDPLQEKRIDGAEAMRSYLDTIKSKMSGMDLRFEMIAPKVQRQGDTVVLTFNLVDYGKRLNEPAESASERWNATEVYARVRGKWRIIHSHWSYAQPQLK